jgi:SAM-dependent methyltransferase
MHTFKSLLKPAIIRGSQLIGIRQSDRAIERDARAYWTRHGAVDDDQRYQMNSHWRGSAIGEDNWAAIGRRHVEMLRRMMPTGSPEQPKPRPRIIEWGCGGGANAVAFGREADQVVGIDISPASLHECQTQVDAANLGDRFTGVLADADKPEMTAATVKQDHGLADLFLCLYVVELLPSKHYVERLLRIARDLLRPGGIAFFQIKYVTSDWRTRPRRWAYRLNLCATTLFEIDEFWKLAASTGLRPVAVSLVPVDELVGDERYAYFFLIKETSETDESHS